MPLLSPTQIDSALRASNLKPQKQNSLKESLDSSNLSLEDCLCELGSIVRCAESDGVKLQAVKTVLEMHGALNKDTVRDIPVINIVINDGQVQVNPILFPR